MQPWFWLHAANIAREFYGVTNPVLEFGRFELTHFWSLSVEEHFYLFWPLLLYFLGRRSILLVTLILVVISTVLKLGLVEISPVLAATPKYLAGLAIGSAAAIYPLLFGRRFLWLCILVLFMMVIWLGVTSEYSYIFSPLISAICACFCVDVTSKKSIYNRPLSNPLLIMFGKYSYGIYVYHYLFAPMLRSVPLHSFPGGYAIGAIVCVTFYLTVPLAIAIASYRWFEAPFLALKDGR